MGKSLILRVFSSSGISRVSSWDLADAQWTERVGVTDWNHALAVIVQILHQRLTQAVYLSLTGFGMISR